MPTVEFNKRSIFERRNKFNDYLARKVEEGTTRVLVNEEGFVVAVHDQLTEPTILYPSMKQANPRFSGRKLWLADKLYAEQEIIDEVEEAIGEKGKVVFDTDKKVQIIDELVEQTEREIENYEPNLSPHRPARSGFLEEEIASFDGPY